MRRILPLIAILLLCAGAMCCALSLGSVAPPHFKSAHAQLSLTGAGRGTPGGSAGDTWCNLVNAVIPLTHCIPFDNASTTFCPTNSSGASCGTANDVIGAKNASLQNVVALGSGPSTNLNNAGIFNSANTTLGAFTVNSLLPSSGPFTLIMYLQVPNSNGNRMFANDNTDSDNAGFQVWMPGDATVGLEIGNGTTKCAASKGGGQTTTAFAMDSFTYDGSTTLTPYVGSTAGSTTPCTITSISAGSATDAAIGYNPAYGADYFTGYIGAIAISATAATSGNISTINGY